MTRKAFTLVEILIVVIILGILAAIVIPQFTEASNDARASALISDLQTVRSQLELYKVQHLDQYPTDIGGGATCQLTNKTDSSGAVDAAGSYGPYLQQFPSNPYVDGDAASTVDAETQGGGNAGWYYDSTTGEFTADTDAHLDL